MASAVLTAALAAGVAGCTSYSGNTLGEQVVSWASPASTGGPSFWSQVATVLTDAQRVSVVERNGDPDAIRTDCVVLSNDTRAVYQLLPTPDAGLTDALDQALTTEENAATDCYGGARGGSELVRSDQERARAATALAAAHALYTTLTAAVPSGSP